MSKLIWLHEDCLRATHNLFAHAPDAQAVFIWDDAYMSAMHYGLNRRVFIYESLCQLPVEIYAGDTVATLAQLAADGQDIITGKTPNPALKAIMRSYANRPKSAPLPMPHLCKWIARPICGAFSNIGTRPKNTPFHMMGGLKLISAATRLRPRATIFSIAVW